MRSAFKANMRRALLRAGKAHDVMALKCRGEGSPLNFGVDEYGDLVPMLPQLSKARLCMTTLPDIGTAPKARWHEGHLAAPA